MTALVVTSAPEPAVVGIAIKLQNCFVIEILFLIILFFKFLISKQAFDIFDKSITLPPPIEIIKFGLNFFKKFINLFNSINSGSFFFF